MPPETRRDQYFRVRFFDRDTKKQTLQKQDYIGAAECTADEILQAGLDGLRMDLLSHRSSSRRHRGVVILIGEPFHEDEPVHDLHLSVENDPIRGQFVGCPRPYISIYRRRANDSWAPIFRSKAVDKEEERTFPKALLQRPRIRRCNRRGTYDDTPLRIELSSHKTNSEHKLLGYHHISLGALKRQHEGTPLALGLCGDTMIELVISQAQLEERSSRFKFRVCANDEFL